MKTQTIFLTALAFGAGYLLFKKKDETTTAPANTTLQNAVPTGLTATQINPANIHLINEPLSNPFAGNPGIGGL